MCKCVNQLSLLYAFLEEKPPRSIPIIEQITTTTTTTTTTNVYCELQCARPYCAKFNAVVEVTRPLP